jgi:hypothetical protein
MHARGAPATPARKRAREGGSPNAWDGVDLDLRGSRMSRDAIPYSGNGNDRIVWYDDVSLALN